MERTIALGIDIHDTVWLQGEPVKVVGIVLHKNEYQDDPPYFRVILPTGKRSEFLHYTLLSDVAPGRPFIFEHTGPDDTFPMPLDLDPFPPVKRSHKKKVQDD